MQTRGQAFGRRRQFLHAGMSIRPVDRAKLTLMNRRHSKLLLINLHRKTGKQTACRTSTRRRSLRNPSLRDIDEFVVRTEVWLQTAISQHSFDQTDTWRDTEDGHHRIGLKIGKKGR